MSSHTNDESGELDMSLSFEEIALAIETSLCHRLDLLDARVDELDKVSDGLEQKVDNLHEAFRTLLEEFKSSNQANANTTNDERAPMEIDSEISENIENLGSKDIYPDGTWLGDENDSTRRVRCNITPMELFHMESNYHTLEKLALALMDSLFDRETMAISSICGGGRYAKQRLDPIKIYAIQCHLRHRFNMGCDDWQRVKNNIDSKCRSAFRRKSQGLPLGSFRERHANELPNLAHDFTTAEVEEKSSADAVKPNVDHGECAGSISGESEGDLMTMTLTGTQLIQTSHGPLQVLHATPEQVAELERTHQIRIVPEDRSTAERDVIEISSDLIKSELENSRKTSA